MQATTDNPAIFALRELIACWDQGYEALAQGDLARVDALLDIAEQHLQVARAANANDLPTTLLQEATSARARLEHGMRVGLEGLRAEMARARQGERALRGYGSSHRDPTPRSGRMG